ncbi:MAG: autotransporter domain-containing protein [Planctomycetia bacterium]|nr:autotransporter domain-containing protein [Planctomycetia bacterium]
MKTIKHVEENVSHLCTSRKRARFLQKKSIELFFMGSFLTVASIVQPALGDTVIPEWNNPVTPHHNGSVWEGTGSQQSGVIDLGVGETYGNSSHIYDGSQLKYYFNDYTSYYSEQEAQLASNIVEATANEAVAAAALAAASAAAVADPSGPAVAAATLAVATADLVIASWALDYFKRWEYEHVAAIDYNSSITVNGYGTLLGTYQNVETLKLTQSGGVIQLGNSSHSGVFRSVDYLDAAGSLILNDSTVLDTLGTVNIKNSLNNEGMIYKVDTLNVTDDIQNSGLMNQVNILTGSNFTNDVDASASFGKVTLTGNLSNAGFFSVDDSLEAKTVTTTGTLHVGGDVKTTQTSGTTFKNTNTAIIGGSLTTYGLENSGVLKVQNTIDATEVKNLTDATLVTDTFQVSTFQNKGNAIATNMTATTLNNETTGGLVVTNLLEATDITNSGSLTAGYIQAKNVSNVGSSAKFWTMNLSGETVENSGTMAIDGVTNVTDSLINTGILTTNGVVTVTNTIQNTNGVWTTYGAVTGKTLTNDASGTIQLGENMKMTATLENSGTIQGVFGAETLMAGTLANTGENAIIENLERVTVAGNLENTGTLKDIERIKVGGNFSTSGENVTGIERLEVSGTSHITNGATIQGTSDLASTFTTNGLVDENGDKKLAGTITGFTTVKNNQSVEITETGKIAGTGTNSTYEQDESLENHGIIENFQHVTINGDASNDGEITGTGDNSELKAEGDLTNRGMVENFQHVNVSGNFTTAGDGFTRVEQLNVAQKSYFSGDDAQITGTGEIASAFQTNGLYGATDADVFNGKITGFTTVKNTQALTIGEKGEILGTDYNSTLDQDDALTNAGKIHGFQNIIISGDVANTGIIENVQNFTAKSDLNSSGTLNHIKNLTTEGIITNMETSSLIGTGDNSLLNAQSDLINSGKIQNFEHVNVAGNFETSGTDVSTIEHLNITGISIFSDGATVTGTGTTASELTTNGLGGTVSEMNPNGDFNGTITGFTTVKNTDMLNVGAEGQIIGTGENSTFTQTGDTVNNGTIGNFQNAIFDGKLENNKTITDVDTFTALADVANEENAQISGTGANSEMNLSGNFTNSGLVMNFGRAQITGELTNDGEINGTDICALLSAQSVNNAGLIQRIETINVAQSMTNTGTISSFRNINIGTETENGGTGTFTNDGGNLNLVVKDDIISKVNVNGTATVSGGTVNVSGDRMAVGKSYVFLTTSDGLTVDEEFIITIDGRVNPKLFHAEGFYNENDYWITSRRNHTYEDLPGATYNQRNTGKYLDQLSYSLDTSNPDYDKTDLYHVLAALDGTADEAEVTGNDGNVRKALDELSGSIYANMGFMTLQNTWYVHQNIANMIRPLDCQYCETDNPNSRERNLWGSFLGNTGEIDSDGNSHGFDYDSYGLIVGSDLMRNDYFRVGAHFQYMDTSMNQNGINSSADMNNYDLGLYGIFQYNLGYILASADFGYTSYDVSRSFAFGGGEDFISRTHFGETDSTQQSVRLESAWDLTMDNRMTLLRPFLAITYSHIQMDGVSETSDLRDTYITELVNHDYDLNSLRSEVGIRATRCFQTDSFTFGINGRATWVHEFCDTYTTLTNNFNNQNEFQNTGSYLVRGVDLGRDYAWLGLGITADTSTAWTFFGGYDALVNSQTLIHNFNLGVSLNW